MIILEDSSGNEIPEQNIEHMFAYYEGLRGLEQGTFNELWHAAKSSEMARWSLMLMSDFELMAGERK